MAIVLADFKAAFPDWADCDDAVLSFWSELAECLVCVPTGCPAIAERMPFLMLAHMLTVNGVTCPAVGAPLPDACECDDALIKEVLNSGAKISSATVDGIAVTFNNVGLNSLIIQSAGKSEFGGWLAQSSYGQMLNGIVSMLNRGVHMAIGNRLGPGHYGDNNTPLGGRNIPGHL